VWNVSKTPKGKPFGKNVNTGAFRDGGRKKGERGVSKKRRVE